MKEFHLSDDPEQLIKISRNFEDERFRLLAELSICNEYQIDIPQDIKLDMTISYMKSANRGKWGSVDKARKNS